MVKRFLLITLSFLLTILLPFLSVRSCAVPMHKRALSLQEQSARIAASNLMSEAGLEKALNDPDYFYALQKLPRDVQELLAKNVPSFLNSVQQIKKVKDISFSADNQVMVIKHTNDTATVWHKAEVGFRPQTQPKRIKNVFNATMSADGQVMVVGHPSGDTASTWHKNITLTVWHRTETGFMQVQELPILNYVENIILSADGRVMLVRHHPDRYTYATVWHRTEAGFVQDQQFQNMHDITLSANGQVMVVVNPVTIWHRTESGFVEDQQIQPINVWFTNLSADGQVMVVIDCNRIATVWHRTEAGFVQDLQILKGPQRLLSCLTNVSHIDLSADGQVMLVRYINSREFDVWHRIEDAFVKNLQIKNSAVILSKDGHVVGVIDHLNEFRAETGWDKTITIWHKTEAGFVKAQKFPIFNNVEHIKLSTDGHLLFIFDKDNTVSIFEYAGLLQSIVVCALNMWLEKRHKILDFKKHWHLFDLLESFSPETKARLKKQFNLQPLTQEQKVKIQQKKEKWDLKQGASIDPQQSQSASENRKIIRSSNDWEASSSNDVG